MREFDLEGLRFASYQADIFEASVERLDCSSLVFLRRFGKSSLAYRLDQAIPTQSLDVNDAFYELSQEFPSSDYGKVKYSPDAMHWLGYIYRYMAYVYHCPTKRLFSLFPVKQTVRDYYVYHTQSEQWCVENWLERFGWTLEDLDDELRAKAILRKRYEK
ncbi:MAG: hypothetical protein IJU64_01885 [Bacilli bacterium]|nr:hypothetical protein [Bacilli bacterium]